MPREQDRFSFVAEVILDSSTGTREVRISDLSLGGCYVDTVAPASEGEHVTFELVDTGKENIRFTGTVAYRIEGQGFGMKFNKLGERQLEYVKRVLGSAK